MRAMPEQPTSAGTWPRGKSFRSGRRRRSPPRWAVAKAQSGGVFDPFAKLACSTSDSGSGRAKHRTFGFDQTGHQTGHQTGQMDGQMTLLVTLLVTRLVTGLIQNHVRNHRITTLERSKVGVIIGGGITGEGIVLDRPPTSTFPQTAIAVLGFGIAPRALRRTVETRTGVCRAAGRAKTWEARGR